MMPPKRRAPAPTAPKEPTPRRSTLAKEHNITASTESEIREAFSLFATSDKPPFLPSPSLRRALTALGVPPSPSDLKDLLEVADPDDEGEISYEAFVAVAALMLGRKDESGDAHEKEVDEAWGLFVRMGGDGDERITMAGLRKVAKLLNEDVSEQVLKDMVTEANGGRGIREGVGRGEFVGVMRRAGVFR